MTIDIPEGHYTKVSVTPITGTYGDLSGGTGTMSAHGTFSCGTFEADDLPQVGKRSTIRATHSGTGEFHQFGAECTHAGPTSDFR